MGSLAGLLKERGYSVTGSDANIYPPMSDQLASLEIRVFQGYKAANLEEACPELVVIGNAVPRTNEEVQAVLEKKIPYLSMPEAVEKLFLKDRFPIVVAGTHGKTTASGLLAWILERTGQSPGFLVGGILKNFEKSCQLGSGDYFVIEGDEYDSAFFDKGPKFLHYRPRMLILNAVEFDHADIYRNLDHLMESFEKLIALMPPSGLIFACNDSLHVRKLVSRAHCRVVTFGLGENCEIRAEKISLGGSTRFSLVRNGKEGGAVTSPLIGRHNVSNLLGVIGALLELGISVDEMNMALAGFQGIKRRQEVLATVKGITVFDDFAHHPTAVRETLAALRGKYGPKAKIWALFEPRSHTTRRNIFQKDFASAFDDADEIVIAPPYLPEKIPEAERLDPEQMIEDLRTRGKKARTFSSIDEIVNTVAQEARSGDVLCFMSNGGFGNIHKKTIEKLQKV